MRWPLHKSLLRHPEIVEHFRKIFVAAVANESNDPFWFCLLTTVTQRGSEQGSGRGATENSFARKKLARDSETFCVVDLKRVSHVGHIGVFGNEIFANAFDCPAASLHELAGFDVFIENGSGGVSQNHFHAAAGTNAGEEPAKSSERPARTNTDNDRIKLVPHLLPDFRACRALMCERVRRISKLVDVKAAGNFLSQTGGDILIIFRMTARHIRAGKPDLRTERADMRDFFLRHLVGNDQDDAVAFRAGDQGEAESGVAGGRLNDGPARLKFSLVFCGFDHGERNTVFDRARRILIFKFNEKLTWPSIHSRDFDERRVADERKNRRRFVAGQNWDCCARAHGGSSAKISFG